MAFLGHPHCDSAKIISLEKPLVYLTVSPRSRVSWLGRVDTRHLVLHWQAPKHVTKRDWIGLFSMDIAKMTNITGKKEDGKQKHKTKLFSFRSQFYRQSATK